MSAIVETETDVLPKSFFRNDLKPHREGVWVFAKTLFLAGTVLLSPRLLLARHTPPTEVPDSRQLLQKLADFSPDPCGPPYGREENLHSIDLESALFDQVADIVTQGLNETPASPAPPRDRVAEALKRLERMSAEINAAWPDENRFHFQILDLPPALVVKMTVSTHGRFFVFGIPEEDSGKSNRMWRRVGSDNESVEQEVLHSHVDLYPLHRGTSGNARFLAKFIFSGCAGSIGVEYDAHEWNPHGIGGLDQVIKQVGALGLDDNVRGFEQIGELRTEGSLITLPYCWFSGIDTWDNPSLCAVDTYDISGDNVKFHARTYNRPDLLPIAKAIEYAEQREYPAVRGYCASSEVAQRLVGDLPPYLFADDLRVTRTGNEKEHVELGDDPTYRFDVEKRAGRWIVIAFSVE
jgi:hypothetical protein